MARLRDVNFVQLDFMEMPLNIQNHSVLVSTGNLNSTLQIRSLQRQDSVCLTVLLSCCTHEVRKRGHAGFNCYQLQKHKTERGGNVTYKIHAPHRVKVYKEEGDSVARVL